ELIEDHIAEVPDTADGVEPFPHRRVRVAADVLDGEHGLAELLLVGRGSVLLRHHCPRFVLGRTRYSLSCLGSAGHRYRTLPSGRRKRDSGTPCVGHTIDVTFFMASPAS